MKIALLISELLKEGGGERQSIYLAKELNKMGNKVVIYTLEYDKKRCFPDICCDLNIEAVGQSIIMRNGLFFGNRIKEYFDMKNLSQFVIKDGKSFDLLNPHGWPPHWAAVQIKQKLNTPIVWMCNDYMHMTKRKSFTNSIRRKLLYYYDLSLVKKIDKIIVLDNRMEEKIVKGYIVHPIVIRSGVDLDKFRAINDSELIRKRHNIDKNTFLLLTVNIPLPHRRIEDVIQAILTLRKRGRKVKLLWIGLLTYHTEYTEYITSLIKEDQLEEDVILANAVPEKEMPLYYYACDAFIFPNEEQTWGLAVTEAMACEKPVIVSTGAGVHEVLENYKTALFISPRKPDLIVKKIEELMDNPELRVRIAKQGYDFVRHNLSWKRYAESMIDVFKGVLK